MILSQSCTAPTAIKPSLGSLTAEALLALIQRVQDVVTVHYPTPMSTSVASHPVMLSEIAQYKADDSAVFKHLKQQSSLIGTLRDENLLQPNHCFIEFGAGKVVISLYCIVFSLAIINTTILGEVSLLDTSGTWG